MTGLDAEARVAEALAAGADGVLHKPYTATTLADTMARVLGREASDVIFASGSGAGSPD